ncbi:MAG: leucyl aminopeptidase [Pseudomonadota bacterium]
MKTSLSEIRVELAVSVVERHVDQVLVVPVFRDGPFLSPLKEIDREANGEIRHRLDRDRFEVEAEKTHWIEIPQVKCGRILLTSLGSRNEFSRSALRAAYGAAARAVQERQAENVSLAWINDSKIARDFDAALEGFLLGAYRFDRYRSEAAAKRRIRKVTVIGPDRRALDKLKKELPRILAVGHASFLARDLVNEPANVVNPALVQEMAGAIAKEQKLRLEVLDEKKLKGLGLNLILAVGMGSYERPRLVHLEYKPKGKARETVALIGKGVTFDSGGLSLKPQSNMYGMKCDMSGAAAVLAAAWGAAQLKLPVHLHVLMPLVENMPSGRSVRPGDIFKAGNGKTVEIENTDAEGRLILADTLAYAQRLGVDFAVDVATLTGACMVALGDDVAGLFGNDRKLIDRIEAAAKRAGEKVWELPLEKAYHRLLKSDVADLKNVGGKYGGAITAALFLEEFVGKMPWAHLDIAGPAFVDRDGAVGPKGGTGFAVRTFLELLS